MEEVASYIASHYWTFVYTFLRLSFLFLAFPFFSTQFVPVSVRVALLLSFSFFFSANLGKELPPPSSLGHFLITAGGELLVGFLMSLLISIFYAIAVYAAELISYMMGLTIANMFDPTFGMVSIVGRLFAFTFYAVFFATGADRVFIASLYASLKEIPVGQVGSLLSLFEFLAKESGAIFFLSFKLAFPFIFALFITNLSLALINRLIPQINVFIVGLPLQIFVGLLLLAVGFSIITSFMVDLTQRFVEDTLKILKVLRGG
jgi:flagellar biosynthetic protein FliR